MTGIGIEKAGKIFYSAMLRKTSDSNYRTYRTWTLEAAKELYPEGCAEFDAVKAAWDAVSVPAQSADPTCAGGSTDPQPVEVDFTGTAALDVQATTLLYSTMTKTDVSLYELGPTYEELAAEYASSR